LTAGVVVAVRRSREKETPGMSFGKRGRRRVKL
jgi:hypothetical protein